MQYAVLYSSNKSRIFLFNTLSGYCTYTFFSTNPDKNRTVIWIDLLGFNILSQYFDYFDREMGASIIVPVKAERVEYLSLQYYRTTS
jgi:hypothetical protein